MIHIRQDRSVAPRPRWLPRLRAIAAAAILAWAAPGEARAASAQPDDEFVTARLISSVAGTGSLSTVPLAVEIKLKDGWKTYWRSPGDAGLPPQLDWSGSANLRSATLLYPTPERLTLLNLQTFGYKHEVVFPVDGVVSEPGRPLNLALKLDLLVCAELCVPKSFALSLKIPAGPASAAPEAQIIARARAAVPSGGTSSGLAVGGVEAVSDGGAAALQIKATARDGFLRPDVVVETEPPIALGLPRIVLADDGHAATFVVPLSEPLPAGVRLTGRSVVVTLMDGPRALEQGVTIAQGAEAEASPASSFLAIIGIALLGGLILNLMPCVLPVLSIKFIAVIGQGGRAPAAVRAGFLATAAGIVASFLLLAAGLIGLKAAGGTIGWGIQFQEPAFIAAMAVLVTLFAGHLLGLFEVPLPRFVAAGASRRLGPDESLAGHFVTGAFATLLATPCSAPFLGTAVGFALAGSAGQMLAIFLALGIGLSLPYLAIAAFPRLAARLPRPGAWMAVVKKALAVPLVATAAWLVGILVTQIGLPAALAVAGSLLAIMALLAVRTRLADGRSRFATAAIAVLAIVAVGGPDLVGAQSFSRSGQFDDAVAWQPFDRNAIRSLVSQGRTVFVDVTADWCLTCQANRRLVLADAKMTTRLNAQTVPMQADWTKPDPAIAAYLAANGRFGIPFNAVYGPGAPGGVVLPELLSRETVDAALEKASSTTGLRRSEAAPPHETADAGAVERVH